MAQPLRLVVEAVGEVHLPIDWCHNVLLPLGNDDVGKDEETAVPNDLCDAVEEVAFSLSVEVVNGLETTRSNGHMLAEIAA